MHMIRHSLAIMIAVCGIFTCVMPAKAQTCDRDCLRATITQYLNAMELNDPSLLNFTDDVRFTEDGQDMVLGTGLWLDFGGVGSFRQDVLDVTGSTAGTHVLAYEGGNQVLVAIRLKLRDGQISEVESTVVRNLEEGFIFRPEFLHQATQAMNVVPAPVLRNTREELITIAMSYPEGLRLGSFMAANTPFATNAYRVVNGQLVAGTGCSFYPGCENLREQRLQPLPEVAAQVAAVDEELGIVWLRMNFGANSILRSEGELSAWQMNKIYDDRINAVEGFMEEVPVGTPFAWSY